MSCKACEEVQDLLDEGAPVPDYLVRVGTANIRIVGCSDHVKQTIELIRKGQHGR